ncbi:MAG TPA: DUF6494 family protein [Pseudolabrys sp.]|nr:DUF6494 family protein [Pseudolabrys sp.]
MNELLLKAAVDRFLKNIQLTAQRELEKVVRSALANGRLQSDESFTAAVTLSSEKVGLNMTIYNKIEL